MRTKKCWILTILFACSVVVLSGRLSGISHHEEEQIKDFGISTLSGLKELTPLVILSTGEDEANKLPSLTQNELQTQVEMALRIAGIRITERQPPLLSIYVALMRDSVAENLSRIAFKDLSLDPKELSLRFYIYTVSTQLYQSVELQRNNKIRTLAPTWPYLYTETRLFGVGNHLFVENEIKNAVTKQMNAFINDYLAANPKDRK